MPTKETTAATARRAPAPSQMLAHVLAHFDNLAALPMKQLSVLYDLAEHLAATAQATFNQPRVDGEGMHLFFNDVLNDCDGLGEAIAKEARGRRPTEDDDADLRAWIILKYEIACGRSAPELAASAAAVAADRCH